MAYEKKDGDRKGGPRRGNGPKGSSYKPKDGSSDRPKRYGDGKKGYGDRKSYGDKPRGGRRSDSDRPKGDRRDRGNGSRGDRRNFSDKPRGDRKRFDDRPRGDRKSYSDRPRGEHFEQKAPEPEPRQEERKILLPQDASRLLYRGIDCQVNGNNALAMVMFLHGSVMLSEGCENNALRLLKEAGKDGYADLRAEIAPNCSDDALVEFDYLCITTKKDYDRTFFDSEYARGSTHAIYRRICLEEVEGDDPVIDEFASRYQEDPKKVLKGLEFERKRKDSESAERHLERLYEGIKLKQSVYVMFTRAMNGDARAVRELKEVSKKVPEAAFFSEFLSARAEGNEVGWLRSKYPQYKDLIISKQGEFKIHDTDFGMFLRAKSLEARKEEWMSVMMNAARAGSPEAMDELSTKMFRNDVRKCLAGIYLKDNDLDNLMIVYQAGLDDMYYLDQYCGTDRDRIVEVGKALGKQSVGKEIDWLKDHYDKGLSFCRDELIERSGDEFYHCKKMIYALHDIGADMEAARLYFEMEDDPEVPSVKWLKKVCETDEVKDYVRRHYEDKGDLATFDFIFEEDGYEHRPKKQFGGRQKGGRSFGGRSGGSRDGKSYRKPRRDY